MIDDELRDNLYDLSSEADLELTQYGLEQSSVPNVRYSTLIPNTTAAEYDPVSDTLWVSLDPKQISEGEKDELRTEIMAELAKAYSIDREALIDDVKKLDRLRGVYNESKRPLELLLNKIEDQLAESYDISRSMFGTPKSVEVHIDRMRKADRNRLNYVRDRFSNLHAWAEEAGDDDEGKPIIDEDEVNFYLDLLEDNFDMLEASYNAINKTREDIKTRYHDEGAPNDKIGFAVSQLIPLEEHATLRNLSEQDKDNFVHNLDAEDEIETVIKSIFDKVKNNTGGDAQNTLRDALDRMKRDEDF